MGVLRIECVKSCTCVTQVVHTLVPSRLATLNTTLWQVSQSRRCTIRLTNISPRKCDTDADGTAVARGPCSKIKIVTLAVAGAVDVSNVNLHAQTQSQQVEGSVNLDFL